MQKYFNISRYQRGYIVYQIYRIRDTEKVFALAYPQPLTESEVYQNGSFINNALKTTKISDKNIQFLQIKTLFQMFAV